MRLLRAPALFCVFVVCTSLDTTPKIALSGSDLTNVLHETDKQSRTAQELETDGTDVYMHVFCQSAIGVMNSVEDLKLTCLFFPDTNNQCLCSSPVEQQIFIGSPLHRNV